MQPSLTTTVEMSQKDDLSIAGGSSRCVSDMCWQHVSSLQPSHQVHLQLNSKSRHYQFQIKSTNKTHHLQKQHCMSTVGVCVCVRVPTKSQSFSHQTGSSHREIHSRQPVPLKMTMLNVSNMFYVAMLHATWWVLAKGQESSSYWLVVLAKLCQINTSEAG